MNYVLKLELEGAEQIQAMLQKLSGLTGGLSSGGGILGGGTSSTTPTQKLANDLERAKGSAIGLKKEIQSIGTAAAQGGGKFLFKELEKYPENVRKAVFAQHPDLEKEYLNRFRGSIKGLRDVGGSDLAKVFSMGQFNPTGRTIKGLRDVTEGDVNKVAALGDINQFNKKGVIKGLRDITGADLAKVQGMGDITQFDKKGFDWKGLLSKGLSIPELTIFAASIYAFKKAVEFFYEGVSKAINQGFHLYTQAAQQGLNTRFFTQRESLAKVLGVSDPNQVFRFGRAVEDISRKTQGANIILSRNAQQLAQVSMNFKVLELDLQALFSEIGKLAGPGLNAAVDGLKLFTKALTGLVILLEHLPSTIIMTQLYKLADMGMSKILNSGAPQVGNLISGMPQLKASGWEHMGLNLGMGAISSTGQILRDSRNYLKVIANEVVRHRGGVGRQFNMGLTTANP